MTTHGSKFGEAEVLQKLRHWHIVECCGSLDMGRAAFLMHPVFVDKEKRIVETLGKWLRKEGRLLIDLLRFGEDLLDVVFALRTRIF